MECVALKLVACCVVIIQHCVLLTVGLTTTTFDAFESVSEILAIGNISNHILPFVSFYEPENAIYIISGYYDYQDPTQTIVTRLDLTTNKLQQVGSIPNDAFTFCPSGPYSPRALIIKDTMYVSTSKKGVYTISFLHLLSQVPGSVHFFPPSGIFGNTASTAV